MGYSLPTKQYSPCYLEQYPAVYLFVVVLETFVVLEIISCGIFFVERVLGTISCGIVVMVLETLSGGIFFANEAIFPLVLGTISCGIFFIVREIFVVLEIISCGIFFVVREIESCGIFLFKIHSKEAILVVGDEAISFVLAILVGTISSVVLVSILFEVVILVREMIKFAYFSTCLSVVRLYVQIYQFSR